MLDELPSNNTVDCIACKEPIRSAATVCRYCGSVQKPQRNIWSNFSGVLKWIGGIVTVISLVIGTVTLSRHYFDWQETRDSVSELVSAADWLVKSEAYAQAWQVYEEALTLAPSSTAIRKGQYQLAKQWLRDFDLEKSRVDEILSRITVILYRNVNEADKQELATALAHIGWVQVLRSRYFLPVDADVDSLFEQALRADPNNIYANAMGGHWLLRRNTRDISVADVKSAQSMFSLALQGGMEKKYVRQLQVGYLTKASHESGNYAGEVRLAILSAMLNNFFMMMNAGEPQPIEFNRRGLFNAYGSINSGGENVEASIGMLPAEDHLKVIDWLLVDFDYKLDTSRRGSQIKYLKARLVETLGRNDEALEAYSGLVESEYTSEKLGLLVDKSIERLTGQLPASVTARNYRDDPVDENNLWAFHSDTLSNFDPKWLPRNYQQAIEYFEAVIKENPAKIVELINLLSSSIERLKSVLLDAEEIKRFDAYHMGFSVGHHENVRVNHVRLLMLYAQALKAVDKIDQAIAVLGDVKLMTAEMGDRQLSLQQMGLYELASTYAARVSVSGEPADITSTVGYLKQFVELGGVSNGVTSWDDIKGDAFAGLRENEDYKALIRGR